MDVRLRWKLDKLHSALVRKRGQNVDWKEIAEGAGVTERTIYNVRENVTQQRLDMSTLKGLLNFFRAQGLDIAPQDVVEIEVVSDAEGKPSARYEAAFAD